MKTLRNTSLITLAVVALALLVAAPVAMADILQTVNYPSSPTNYGVTTPVDMGSFNLFDSTTGTLNSVTLTFAGGVTGTITFHNGGDTASNVIGNDTGTLTLTSANNYINTLFSPLSVTTNQVSDFLAAGATGSAHPVTGTASTAGIAVSAADFSIFEAAGGGTVDDLFLLKAIGGTSVSSDNGVGSASYTTNAGAAVKIDYNYTPLGNNPVPEPGTLSLFGTGLLGLAGMLRSRFSKAS
jgi:hypothetical protein